MPTTIFSGQGLDLISEKVFDNVKVLLIYAVKLRLNGFEGTSHCYPLLPKFVIANMKRENVKGLSVGVKFP